MRGGGWGSRADAHPPCRVGGRVGSPLVDASPRRVGPQSDRDGGSGDFGEGSCEDLACLRLPALQPRTIEYGEYPIVSVRTDDGHDFAFHAFHTVAKGELEKLPPKLGDRIGIAYHGPDPVKGYERYRIVIVRGAGEGSRRRGAAPCRTGA